MAKTKHLEQQMKVFIWYKMNYHKSTDEKCNMRNVDIRKQLWFFPKTDVPDQTLMHSYIYLNVYKVSALCDTWIE